MAIASPFDILELRPEGELITRVTAIDEGAVEIKPRDGRPPKAVHAVRLYVPPEDKQTAPFYWDVTSQTLRPSLVPIAARAITEKRFIRLHKYGSGPGARFGVELMPAEFTGPPRADTLNQAGP